jgi:hypothetical protein
MDQWVITLCPVLWASLGFVGSPGFGLCEGIFRTVSSVAHLLKYQS